MIRLNILNMKKFLKEVGACGHEVYLLHDDGSREDIRKRFSQNLLQHQFERQHGSLKMKLEIPDPKDYFRIVAYYAGDC